MRLVADTAKAHGPFAAVVLLRDNGAYGRFDKELFAPLVPDLKIVACVNARYSELDLEWFSRNKVYVTSTVDAFTRPTADITMFLILAVLRDTSNFERNVRLGGWRNVTSPPRDPYGLKLGIIGMGKVGKVGLYDRFCSIYNNFLNWLATACCQKGKGLWHDYSIP